MLPPNRHHHRRQSRPRRVPPNQPPAHSAVTLPARQTVKPHTNAPAPNSVSASRRIGFWNSNRHRRSACAVRGRRAPPHLPIGGARQPSPIPGSAPPPATSGAKREWLWNRAHPSLARGWPCRQSSLARLRAPMWLRAFLRVGRYASSAPSTADRRRCERSSHGVPRAGLPFGPAQAFSSAIQPRPFYGRESLRSTHSRVSRSAPGRRGPPR
jgi:hypothetical protein